MTNYNYYQNLNPAILGYHSKSGCHIYFMRDSKNNQKQSTNNLTKTTNRNNAKILFLFDGSFTTEILKNLPNQFTITTKSGSGKFNVDILKDTSSVISDFLKENPDTMHYHIDIDDNENILGKFEKLYQGEKVIFDEDDLPISKKITKTLNILNCPNYMKPESLKTKELVENNGSNLSDGVVISKFHLSQFLRQDKYQIFKIVTNKNEYICNIFGIYSSKVIRDLLLQNPTLDRYEYDFNDEYGEFQPICKLFNFGKISITSNNMDVLKEIAENLKIDDILPKIEKNIKEYEKVSKIIDEKQTIINSIEELFGWLYDINNLTVETVKNSIVESNWSKTEENVLELAAYLIQVVKSDFKFHSNLIDLIIQLDKEANESNNLEILLPFISKQIMFYFGESLQVCSFIYNLYKREMIKQEDLFNALKEKFSFKRNNNNAAISLYNIDNIHAWFLPEIMELNLYDKQYFTENNNNNNNAFGGGKPRSNNSNIIKFINYYYPNKIDLYKKLRDSGQPSDELTTALRNDDVDTVQRLVSRIESDFSEIQIPFNIFEGYISNGRTSIINYAAAYRSIKCFKYLLLNHSQIDDFSFQNAVYGGNIEIIKIVDQQSSNIDTFQNNNSNTVTKKFGSPDLTRKDIYPAILKHQNDLFDWIFEQKYSNQTNLIETQSSRLLNHSIENGNAHSFIEVIDKCATSNDIKELIQIAARNGFYRLAKLALDILNERSEEFRNNDNPKNNAGLRQQSSYQRMEYIGNNEVVPFDSTFVFFGNLSIFKIGLKIFNNQEQLEKSLSYCIDREFTSIFDYYFDELIKNDFKITNSCVLRSVSKSLSKQDPYYFNHLIEKIKIINPNFFYGFNSLSYFLKTACSSKNTEYIKTILAIAKEYHIKPNITSSFIEAALNESKDICQYFVDENWPIDYQQILMEINSIGKFNSDIFSILLNNANPGVKYVLLTDTLTPAIRNKNKNLVELLLSQKEPNDDSLIEAVLINDLDIVNIILDHNNKPSFVNNKSVKGSALFIATDKNYVNIVERLLLVKGIDPSLYERNDKTPLISSIVNLNLKIMNLILDFYGDEIEEQAWQLNKAIKMIFEMISAPSPEQMNANNNTNVKKWKDNKNAVTSWSQAKKVINKVENEPKINVDKDQILSIIRRLLKIQNIDPNCHGGDFTLLSFACENNDIEIIKNLLKNENVDVNSYAPTSGNTPLMIAIKNKNEEIAELFITDDRTNINAKNYHNKTALIMAVEKNLIKIVELILENEKFDPDESCLNYAFMISTGQISKRLISEKSLDVNYNYPKNIQNAQQTGKNNFNKSIGTGHPYSQYQFGRANNNNNNNNNQNNNNNNQNINNINQINNNNNVNQIHPVSYGFGNSNITNFGQFIYNFETPLTYAVKFNNEEKVDLIIQCPSFDKTKSQIEKCIFDSLKNNHFKIFDKLLALIDNDANICDFSNRTLLHAAIKNQNDRAVTKILNNEKFDSKKNDFLDAFISSYTYKSSGFNVPTTPNIMKLLFEYDKKHDNLIDLSKLLPNGFSFYTIIKSPGNVRNVVNFLLENGADPNVPDINGFYPLEYAIYVESREFVSSLLDSGKIDLSKQIPVKDESIVTRYTNRFNKNRVGFGTTSTKKSTTNTQSDAEKQSSKQSVSKSKYKNYLHLAAKSKNGILDLFLTDESLDVNVEDDQGDTPFIDACRTQNLDNVRLLFDKENIDYNHINKNGEDALKILNSSVDKPKNKDEFKNALCTVFKISPAAFDAATNNGGRFGGWGFGNRNFNGNHGPFGRPVNYGNHGPFGRATTTNNNTNANNNTNVNNNADKNDSNNDNAAEIQKTPEASKISPPDDKSELSDQGSTSKKKEFSFRTRARAKTLSSRPENSDTKGVFSFIGKNSFGAKKADSSNEQNEEATIEESKEEPQTLKEKSIEEPVTQKEEEEAKTLKEESHNESQTPNEEATIEESKEESPTLKEETPTNEQKAEETRSDTITKRSIQIPEVNSTDNDSKSAQNLHEEDNQPITDLSNSLNERISQLKANSSEPFTNNDSTLSFIHDFLVLNQLTDFIESYSQASNSLSKTKDEALNFINENKASTSLPVLNLESNNNKNINQEETLDSSSCFNSDVDDDEELLRLKTEVKSLEQKLEQVEEKLANEKKTKSINSTPKPILAPLKNNDQETSNFIIKEPPNETIKQPPQTATSPVKASPRSIQRRIKVLKKKSANGDSKAQFQLGVIYSIGEGVQQDQSLAFNYYKMAADQGDKNAQFMVASYYSYGKGTEVDKNKAFPFYLKSAEQGYVKAQFAVGHFYEYGQGGVELDHEKAVEWYSKAAEQGHKGAINALQNFSEE